MTTDANPERSDTMREVVRRLGFDAAHFESAEHMDDFLRQMRKRDRRTIISAALQRFGDAEDLEPYQAELIRMQMLVEATGRKVIILFDGRDASGKGGTIRRVTRYMNGKHYRVVALGKPSEHQRTELHLKRYIEHFPHAGQIVLFDRSWYNRAMVEPVMGFCTPKQHRHFMEVVNDYEESFVADGDTTLIKLYFSVSKEEQERRFERRRNDPLRQWKLSEVDLQAQELWDLFTEAKYKLLKRTHTRKNPWYVIRSDDKHRARIETMKLILRLVKYRGRSRSLDFTRDPEIVIPGGMESKRMERERRTFGHFKS